MFVAVLLIMIIDMLWYSLSCSIDFYVISHAWFIFLAALRLRLSNRQKERTDQAQIRQPSHRPECQRYHQNRHHDAQMKSHTLRIAPSLDRVHDDPSRDELIVHEVMDPTDEHSAGFGK
mmetsp:Transcript_13667/g.24767  ORF Transcript_13667/g.24767 Transcript_13667/m.24767 type:complete len:119 (-) Transcript_13667:305-661(-)